MEPGITEYQLQFINYISFADILYYPSSIHFTYRRKGGDRDGNPFVVASFSNQAFIDQRQFVLEHYIDYAKELLEALTPSTRYIAIDLI